MKLQNIIVIKLKLCHCEYYYEGVQGKSECSIFDFGNKRVTHCADSRRDPSSKN